MDWNQRMNYIGVYLVADKVSGRELQGILDFHVPLLQKLFEVQGLEVMTCDSQQWTQGEGYFKVLFSSHYNPKSKMSCGFQLKVEFYRPRKKTPQMFWVVLKTTQE